MTRLILTTTVLVLIVTLIHSQGAFAQGCVVTGSTPEGGQVVVCSGVDTNGLETTVLADEVTVEPDADLSRGDDNVIRTFDGNDLVRMNGGRIETDGAGNDCINLGVDSDEFHMTAGTLICHEDGVLSFGGGNKIFTVEGGSITVLDTPDGEEALQSGGDDDEFYISGGQITGFDAAIDSLSGNDTIIVTGGMLKTLDDGEDSTIDAGGDNDLISVSNALVDGTLAENGVAVGAGSGDDTVRLGTRAEILGLTSGGADVDMLVFEMAVNESQIPSLCRVILSMDPDEGSIAINGLLYEWIDFEEILCELVPGDVESIPTLSEWGLIATVVVLGIAGLLAIRRKKASV